ncbi:MAG: glycine zipper family protein [Acidobacteriota bacterium]
MPEVPVRPAAQPVIVPSPPRPLETQETLSNHSPPPDLGQEGRSSVPARVTPPPAPAKVVLPQGTPIQVRLGEAVDSRSDRTGDNFEAVLDKELIVNGKVIAAQGSRLIGRLENVSTAGKVKGRAQLELALVSIEIQGRMYQLETNFIGIQAPGSKSKDAKVVGVGAGIGALIGAIAGGKKGAAIGTLIGGGAGTVGVLSSKGKSARLEKEHLLTFRLERDLEVETEG